MAKIFKISGYYDINDNDIKIELERLFLIMR